MLLDFYPGFILNRELSFQTNWRFNKYSSGIDGYHRLYAYKKRGEW